MSDADAASVGEAQHLVGLRQGGASRTTVWLFNPGDGGGEYDVVYRRLDGSVAGTLAGIRLEAGRLRQLGPADHAAPAAELAAGFTVEVKVKSGKVLAAAQVTASATDDPTYVRGEKR